MKMPVRRFRLRDAIVIYRVAQKINRNCAPHKENQQKFGRNPGVLRNGSLIFWKLATPNLNLGPVYLPASAEKRLPTAP
jgi:hypothetical protein